MRLIARLMPGNVVSSVFTTSLCLTSCILTLVANPTTLVPLFILSAASLGVQLPVLFMVCLHEFQQRGALTKCDTSKMRGVHQAGNQLGLTLVHTVIWLAVVAVYIVDLAHTLSSPRRFTCPSPNCARYGTAITLVYVILFTFIAQLLGFGLIIYEVQSAPRRVLADRSLSTILKKSVPQFISIREETRRVRDLGDDRPERRSLPMSELTFAETTGALRRIERTASSASLPGLTGSGVDEEKRGRRRNRTASASILLAGMPLRPRHITLDELRPIIVHAGPGPAASTQGGDDTLELHQLDSRARIQHGRYPTISTGPSANKPIELDLADPFLDDHAYERYSFFRNPRAAPSPPLETPSTTRRSLASGLVFSPAQAESAVLPFESSVLPTTRSGLRMLPAPRGSSSGPFSPESRYSHWSVDMSTPRVTRAVSTATTGAGRDDGDPEVESPKDEHVLTPT